MTAIFPYIVIGGNDAMGTALVASSELRSRVAFVLMIGLQDDLGRELAHAEENLVLELVTTVATALDAVVNYLEDMSTPARASASVEDFRKLHSSLSEDESEPLRVPSLVTMVSNGTMSGIMVCEGWFNTGGPWPYHDSYTYATYLKDKGTRQRVVTSVLSLCKRLALSDPELVILE